MKGEYFGIDHLVGLLNFVERWVDEANSKFFMEGGLEKKKGYCLVLWGKG